MLRTDGSSEKSYLGRGKMMRKENVSQLQCPVVEFIFKNWDKLLEEVAKEFEPMSDAKNQPTEGGKKLMERLRKGKSPIPENSKVYKVFYG